MTYRMVNPTYRPRKAEQTVFANALGIQDFQNLLIDGGDLGDNKVVVTIEKISQECKDRYTIERKPQGNFFLNTEKCVDGKLGKPDISEVVSKDPKTIALNALFLPDANFHNAKLPKSWLEAKALLAKPESLKSLMMWQMANPRLDPLREQWAFSSDEGISINTTTEGPLLGVKAPSPDESKAWKNFALFLETVVERLIEGATKGSQVSEEMKKGFELAIPFFATLHEDIKKGTYNIERLNQGFDIAFDDKEKEALYQSVRHLLYSEFPFAPQAEIDQMAKAMSAWATRRRILVSLAKEQKDQKIDITQIPTPAQMALFKNQLGEILENPNSSTTDIEALKVAYRKELWVLQFQSSSASVLIHPDTVDAFAKAANIHFDQTVAVPALQALIQKIPDLKGEKRTSLEQQVNRILRIEEDANFNPKAAKKVLKQVEKGEAHLSWNLDHVRNQFETLVTAQQFLDTRTTKDEAISILANRFEKKSTWRLDLNDANFVLQNLKDLKVSLALAKAITQAFLDLNEGRQVKITPMARQTLELALSNDFGAKELPPALVVKAAPKGAKPAVEVKKGPVEGVNWENLREQAIAYYRHSDEAMKKRALPQLKQAAAAQAGSPEWQNGIGWEKSTDWKTLDMIAKAAWDKELIEDAFMALKKSSPLASTPEQKENFKAKSKSFGEKIGAVTITQDPNQADSVQKGYVVLQVEKLMIGKESKAALDQAINKLSLSKEGVSLPLTVYLAHGKYEANGIKFEIKKGEKEPNITLGLYKDLPKNEVFSWSQWVAPSVVPGIGASRMFRAKLAVVEPEKPVVLAEKK